MDTKDKTVNGLSVFVAHPAPAAPAELPSSASQREAGAGQK